MKLGTFNIHRQEQWDLECTPVVCIHKDFDKGNGSKRIFCLWFDRGLLKLTLSNPLKYRW